MFPSPFSIELWCVVALCCCGPVCDEEAYHQPASVLLIFTFKLVVLVVSPSLHCYISR